MTTSDPWRFAGVTFEGDVLLLGFQWDDGRLRSGGRLGFRNVAGRAECVSASFGEVVGLGLRRPLVTMPR